MLADPHWLPFAENGVDLIVLPHVLEFTDEPHQLLREVHRVIRPEGHLIIAGFNPFSLFGAKRYFGREQTMPWTGNFIALYRLKDWLSLLGFEVVGRQARLLRAAVPAGKMAASIRLLREGRRSLVADCRAECTSCARPSAFWECA